MNATTYEFHPPYWCDVDVIDVLDPSEGGRVLIVRPRVGGPTSGARYYDVWVGPDENREKVGSTNTEGMARAYARNFLPDC